MWIQTKALTFLAAIVICLLAREAVAKKNYLLIGLTGSGKSTIGNCMYNRRGEWSEISQRPFVTSDSSSGCTRIFESVSNQEMTILDTIGFGDPQFEPKFILDQLKEALKRVNNQIDCVIFVVRQGRFSQEVVQFFEFIQEKLLKSKCKHNSVLVVSQCQRGWLSQPEQKKNQWLQRALENTNHLSYEFHLKRDDQDDDDEDKAKNVIKRKNAISGLVAYLDSRHFEKIDLAYVQSADFEREWYKDIWPALENLFNKAIKALENIVKILTLVDLIG